MKISTNIKNLLRVLSANIFVMGAGIVQSLMLPSVLGPEQYGYWSVYLTYISYAGFFNLGIADGIYLLHGGEEYEKLDKRKFKTYLKFSFIYLTTLCLVACSISIVIANDLTSRLIMIAVALSSWMQCLISSTVMIDQATSRFSIYSKGHVIEKISILIGTFFLFISNYKMALIVIGFSLIGRVITLIYYYSNTKPILFARSYPLSIIKKEIIKYSIAGIWLTLAAIGTTAMTNIGRSFVQSKLGITELGYYSFVFSLLGLFTLFFSAIATVLFPMMKRTSGENYYKQMNNLDSLLNWFGVIILLFIIPAKILLPIVFPQYVPALHCLVVLFPLAILLGKNSMIYFTTYKVERLERQYVYNLGISLVLCFLLNFLSIKIYPDIISPAVSTYISFMIWTLISVYVYNKKSKNHYSYGSLLNITSLLVIILSVSISDKRISYLATYVVILVSASYSSLKILPVIKEEIAHIKMK